MYRHAGRRRRRDQHQGAIFQISHRHPRPPRQRIPRAHHGDERFAVQALRGDGGGQGRGRSRNQAHVGAAVAHRRHDGVRLRDVGLDGHAGELIRVSGQRGRQERHRQALDGRHLQTAGEQAAQRGQIVRKTANHLQRPPGPRRQQLARRGGAHAVAGPALQEVGSRLSLQAADGVRERRLRGVDELTRAGHVALVHARQEIPEIA